MAAYDWALFLHLLGAFTFFAGIAVAAVAYEAARRRRSLVEIATLLALARVGVAIVGAGTLLLLAFGLWLVGLAGYRYGDEWIVAALVLFAAANVLGAAGGRRPKKARLLAARLAREGEAASPDVARLLNDRLALALNYTAGLVALAVLALMIWKPGAG